MTGPRPGGYAQAATEAIRHHPEVRAAVTAATRTFDSHRVQAWAEIETAKAAYPGP